MIVTERAHLFVAANTHPGMKGKNNEDRYAISAHRLGPHQKIPSVLAVVCDGIGGHRAGEVAAEIAVETISRIVAQSDGTQPLATLRQAIQDASASIRAQAEADPERQGMGATCVCAWVIGDRLYSASVGDSRLYLIRNDQIQQLTTDHTWIQEALEFGALTPEQARGHPNAHVIRRYLGSQNPVEPDFRMRLNPTDTDEQAEANQGARIQPGDYLVLCSDGLTDLVEKEEILALLKSQEREKALQSLIDLANERGGHDNITIVTLEVPPALKTGTQAPSPKAQAALSIRRLALPCLVITLAMSFLTMVALAAFWVLGGSLLDRNPTPTASPIAPPGLGTTPAVTMTVVPSSTLTPSQTAPATPAEITLTQTLQPAGSGEGYPKATYTPWPTNTLPPTPALPSETTAALPSP